jgi:ribosomal protein S2
MNDLRVFIESDDFASLTKKEQLTHKRKLAKAERLYKGVTGLKNIPDLVIVVDGQMMNSLIQEIEKKSIDSIVIASTNFSKFWNPANLVVANIAGYKSLDFVLQYILS